MIRIGELLYAVSVERSAAARDDRQHFAGHRSDWPPERAAQ